MIQLGVSLYPEQETPEEIDHYLELAGSYGFTKVFTSLFSVEGSKEQIIQYFRGLSDAAHKYGMQVYGDCNARFFMEMGASPEDLSVFKEMGLDVLRLDLMFNDERDVAIVNNGQGLGVQLNASLVDSVKRIIGLGGDRNRIIGSYNFYPLRNTGADSEDVYETNHFFKNEGIRTQIFISSGVKGTHGPWPADDRNRQRSSNRSAGQTCAGTGVRRGDHRQRFRVRRRTERSRRYDETDLCLR